MVISLDDFEVSELNIPSTDEADEDDADDEEEMVRSSSIPLLYIADGLSRVCTDWIFSLVNKVGKAFHFDRVRRSIECNRRLSLCS